MTAFSLPFENEGVGVGKLRRVDLFRLRGLDWELASLGVCEAGCEGDNDLAVKAGGVISYISLASFNTKWKIGETETVLVVLDFTRGFDKFSRVKVLVFSVLFDFGFCDFWGFLTAMFSASKEAKNQVIVNKLFQMSDRGSVPPLPAFQNNGISLIIYRNKVQL